MRIRGIKPEFWRSEDIARLALEDRLLFVGLWSYVDDNGVGRDVPKVIVADLFALEDDPRETLATVSRGLANLAEAGLITRYTVDGRPFLHVTTWDRHQRIDKPNKPRYPLPTCEDAQPSDNLARPSRQSRDIPALGAVEQGSSGAGEQLKDTPSPAAPSRPSEPRGFAEFWDVYPRKVGKVGAVTAYAKALRMASATEILDGVSRYAQDPNLGDKEFMPHPARWLNEGRWNDEPLPPRDRSTGTSSPGRQTTDDKVRTGLTLAADIRAETTAAKSASVALIGA